MDYTYTKDDTVIILSNSGKTKECVLYLDFLQQQNITNIYIITATPNSLLTENNFHSHILNCGKENAVAATKSVIEQALVIELTLREFFKSPSINLVSLSLLLENILDLEIPRTCISKVCQSETIFWCGRNN